VWPEQDKAKKETPPMATEPKHLLQDPASTPGTPFIILMLAQTVSFIDRMIMGLLVGPIRQSFDISDTQYSLLADSLSPFSTRSWGSRWHASRTAAAANT
jgi:hypothetical protein